MQVPKFKEFITETDIKRRDKPMTIAIVTVADSNDPKENTTADLLTKICKKKGIKCIIVNTKSTIITAKDEDKSTLTVYNYDGKNSEHTFVGRDTICFVRGGALEDEAGLSLEQELKVLV
jgi:ribosomal protein L7Ae-like RNA K-turn-binding protein